MSFIIICGLRTYLFSTHKILAGFHEVAVTKSTLEAIESARSLRPERPLIRISSTFFWHLDADYELKPLSNLKLERRRNVTKEYPPMKVGALVQAWVFTFPSLSDFLL
jgi:hypothetical protein